MYTCICICLPTSSIYQPHLPTLIYLPHPSTSPTFHTGRLTLTFFERRRSQSFFGLVQNEEKVIFEEWVIPLLVDVTPSSMGEDSASGM